MLFPHVGEREQPRPAVWASSLTNLFFRIAGRRARGAGRRGGGRRRSARGGEQSRASADAGAVDRSSAAARRTASIPPTCARFLTALGVPLYYWTVGPAREGATDAWGEAKPVRGWGGVHLAVGELIEALRPQFLVWIEGLHKPGDVTLAPGAPAELRLAGSSPAAISAADTRPSRRASPAGAE